MTYPPPPPGGPTGPAGDPYQQPPVDATGWQPPPGAPMSGVPSSGQPFHTQQYPQQPAPGDPYASPQYDQFGQPVSGAPGQPWPGAPVPPPARSGSKGWLWGALAGVVVIALVVAGVLIFTSDDETQPLADPTGTPSAEPSEDDSQTGTDPADLLVDPDTGLGYAKMGEPWADPGAQFALAGFRSTTGEMLTVIDQPDYGWVAIFIVGELNVNEVGFTGPDTLESSVTELAAITDATNYSAPPDWTEPLDGFARDAEPVVEEIEIGGFQGVVSTYHLSWDDDRLPEETGETVILGVIDLGDGRAAGFSISLPDSVPQEQVDQVEAALESLQFA
ncbi:hypothetical protein LX16_0500 [Stackebrandtia albiflava]|uniref:Uncharacterized protein n=1 Tax=Stackebrandtia albiflava TaxID=406432 RepID=A0A562VAD1_9ACTN|nr:YrzE family protein [Stackebrandtia albiflava]TWJ14808.1 hypothetical protein LX16_0500 [Stackebrandtia albiflava]